MSRTYSRDDVETHSDGFGRYANPAVNVKIYGDIRDAYAEFVAEESPDPRFTLDWIEEHVSDDVLDSTFWHVCEFEFEYLADYAPEILGEGITVSREGRSGGWAVVEGLPEIEEWDAVRVAKWRKFERIAKEIAAGVPFQILSSLYLNQFDQWSDEEDDRAPYNAEAPVDLALA